MNSSLLSPPTELTRDQVFAILEQADEVRAFVRRRGHARVSLERAKQAYLAFDPDTLFLPPLVEDGIAYVGPNL